MIMKSEIAKANELSLTKSGFYTSAETNEDDLLVVDESASDYRLIKEILQKTSNRCSNSPELDKQWVFWPTEYHLSSARSNILKALDLSKVNTALELGCLCGAMTRYLGEQGIVVDAVEEKLQRADIAKLRCHDLDNVNICHLPLEQLKIPENTYDAIFLIDALANAQRGSKPGCNSERSIVKLLHRVGKGLKTNGIIFMATHNRMGLKYWLGASEDYYGGAHKGLDGYAQHQYICAHSKKKWEGVLEKAGMGHYRFIYPFPDHKLAEVILAEDYIQSDPYSHSLLYRIRSRDYHSHQWEPIDDEYLRWRSLHRSGYLQDFANSFLIVVSKNEKRLNDFFPYDFIKFSNPSKNPKYLTVTFKQKNDERVIKKTVSSGKQKQGADFIDHHPIESNYYKGPLLSSRWICALMDRGNLSEFNGLLKAYYVFLGQYSKQFENSGLLLDLLPFNIVVDNMGRYRTFDLEWESKTDVTPEFIFFRALMWFAFSHSSHLSRCFVAKQLHNIYEFIQYGFDLLSLDLQNNLADFIAAEESLQSSINTGQIADPVRTLIMQPFQSVSMMLQSKTFNAQLYWVTEADPLCNENSVLVLAPLGPETQNLFFRLPQSVINLKKLRLDPADRPGFFHIYRVVLKWVDLENQKEKVLWQISGEQNVAAYAILEDIQFCYAAMGNLFLSTSDDPKMIFEFPKPLRACSNNGYFSFEVQMDWPKTADYLVSTDSIKAKSVQLEEKEIRFRELETKFREREMQLDNRIVELIDQVKERDTKIHIMDFKLNLLRQSKLMKLLKLFK
jgi:hypothetical protein